MTFARNERLVLCDTALAAGPDASTLDEGWTVADLVAHLHIRESDPLAAMGIMVPALAGLTARHMDAALQRYGFEGLLEIVRNGPGRWSPLRLPGVDEKANGTEMFIHHEDIRRGGGGLRPAPRELGSTVEDALWRSAGMAKLVFRSAPEHELRRAGGSPQRVLHSAAQLSGSRHEAAAAAADVLVVDEHLGAVGLLVDAGEPEGRPATRTVPYDLEETLEPVPMQCRVHVARRQPGQRRDHDAHGRERVALSDVQMRDEIGDRPALVERGGVRSGGQCGVAQDEPLITGEGHVSTLQTRRNHSVGCGVDRNERPFREGTRRLSRACRGRSWCSAPRHVAAGGPDLRQTRPECAVTRCFGPGERIQRLTNT